MLSFLAKAWGLLSSPLARALGVGLIALSVLGYAYSKGYGDASAKCEAEALRAKIATLERDLDISRKAELRAREQEAAAEAREDALNERLTSYETGLGTAPDVCLLSPADADGLRKLTK